MTNASKTTSTKELFSFLMKSWQKMQHVQLNQKHVVMMQTLHSHVQSTVLIITLAQMNVMIYLKKKSKKKIAVKKQKQLNFIFPGKAYVTTIKFVAEKRASQE